MSLPLISFLFYYILGRYFCNGTSNTAKAIFNKVQTAGGICSEIVWNDKVEEYFQKERTHNGALCSEIIVNDSTKKAHSQGPAASRQLSYPSNTLCSGIIINGNAN